MPGQSSEPFSIDVFDFLRVFAAWVESPDETTWTPLSDSTEKSREPPEQSGGSFFFGKFKGCASFNWRPALHVTDLRVAAILSILSIAVGYPILHFFDAMI
jgi:hypothetical protein